MVDDDWLRRFHDGERAVMEEMYRDHYDVVSRAVGRIVGGADQETLVHELFFRLLHRREAREGFTGGSLAAWLTTLARNLALDHLRARGREVPFDAADAERLAGGAVDEQAAAEARDAIETFRRDWLPPGWERLFQLRFVERLSQREAARVLGIRRTTLAYRELRIRRLLQRFVLRGGLP